MNKLFWKRAGITAVSVIGGAYAVFLISPLILNPIVDSYIPQIKNIIHETSGLNSELTNVKVVTTPKLTAGLKVGKFSLLEPDNTRIFSADDFQVKMSLLPILAGKIRVDAVHSFWHQRPADFERIQPSGRHEKTQVSCGDRPQARSQRGAAL